MRYSRILPCAICLLLGFFLGCPKPKGAGGNGVGGGPPIVQSSADVVRLGGFGVGFSAPGKGSVEVPIRIDDGYHINANPATYPYLIATEVATDKVADLDVGKPIYPAAIKKKFQFADEPLAVYEGNVNVTLPLVAHSSGTKSLPITVRVQACDQEKCYPPATLKATVDVHVD